MLQETSFVLGASHCFDVHGAWFKPWIRSFGGLVHVHRLTAHKELKLKQDVKITNKNTERSIKLCFVFVVLQVSN